jgi:hypothetical protein
MELAFRHNGLMQTTEIQYRPQVTCMTSTQPSFGPCLSNFIFKLEVVDFLINEETEIDNIFLQFIAETLCLQYKAEQINV